MSRRAPRPSVAPQERKTRLHAAREALTSGTERDRRLALANLPPDGAKAAALRQALMQRLAGVNGGTAVAGVGDAVPLQAALDLSSHGFSLSTWDGGAGPLLETKVCAGDVELAINRNHPCFRHIVTVEGEIQPAAAVLLMGWASFEIEAGGERRKERIRDMLRDWSLAVGRLAKSLHGEP